MEADAKTFRLPFPVLVGRDSKIILDYRLTQLPMLFILDDEGKIRFLDSFASSGKIREIIDPILDKLERIHQEKDGS